MLCCQGCSKAGAEQWKCSLPPSWRLEVQDQGVRRVVGSARGLSLACRRPSPPCVPTASSSACVCVLLASSYEDTRPVGSGPIAVTSFALITSVKAFSPNAVASQVQGLGL